LVILSAGHLGRFQGHDIPLAGTAIIAPGKWVERIAITGVERAGIF
jgi:hypothetical protein